MQRPLWNRFATFLVWLLAAVCAVYWALKFASGPVAPASAAVAASSGMGSVDPLALAKGLGGGGKPPPASSPVEAVSVPSLQASRFVLTGVVVQKAKSGQGVALIAVDGKPPRPYRVNATLADGVILHSVSAGKAMLATGQDAAPSLSLELPQLTSAVAGTAVAIRPAMPSPVIASNPAPMLPPMAAATPQANSPANSMAGPGTPGQRPPRPGANRQQADKDSARDQ
ncbi:MAG: hypothetical protein EAZ37_08660 [Burkholderiales bacterium]|nr:MAG: hypothetical protein EAZ37_08660 [Burkholderiales bacterium]